MALTAQERQQASKWATLLRGEYREGEMSPERLAIVRGILGSSWLEATDLRNKPVKAHVPVAEKLAAEHGGALPHSWWLANNGYNGLAQAMRKYPELFAHIPQAVRRKRIEDRVPEAEKLARENGGVVPADIWLRKNGFVALSQAMRLHPHLFAHLAREKRNLSAKEWVPGAEKLARENGGKLPAMGWLQHNNFKGLTYALRVCPELFAHIPQEKPQGHFKSPEEWVPTAEELAQRNGGVLRNSKWLYTNGYSGLVGGMRKCPELFMHIPQEARNNAGRLMGFRNGTAALRRALEIKHGLLKPSTESVG